MTIFQSKISLLFTFLLIFFVSKAQEDKLYIEGDVLIQLESSVQNVDQVIRDNSLFLGQTTALELVEKLSNNLNIWHLRFNADNVNHSEFIRQIGLHKNVIEYQNNHKIENRATPNDTEFNQQWQYINPGGSGGIIGADIDADLAWDITTGGVTPLGDTIVVCVIDDGILETHEDLVENLWLNHGEIENNGIDDDANGYIDDYRGYNANNSGAFNLDDIYSLPGNFGVHGNAVAGVVGAKGNNNLGVAGINWDVKLMIVKNQGLQESQVIKAYDYPLTMRKLYNETGGMNGAFVVTVNSSWGVPTPVQPSVAPLWCAFYDEMGEAGIINAAATHNLDVNVDVEGDLPTGCSSDYLLSVTNVWRDDQKVTDAGYGLTTIDIGAFGRSAHTLSQFNTSGYTGFGGTSGATPQVAGAIALLYSAPCPSFASLYTADPAAAALKAKEYVMNGGDDNFSLQNITVSGKRLNLNGMLTQLNLECSDCPIIKTYDVVGVQDESVSLDVSVYGSLGDVDYYEVRYRKLGESNWTIVALYSLPLSLTGLAADVNYEYQVRIVCDASISPFTSTKTFSTNKLSINQLAIENGIKVYPNPAKDIVYISLDELQADFEIAFYDISGKLIYSGNMLTQKKKIDISVLNSGIYILKLKDSKGNTFSHKITKL